MNKTFLNRLNNYIVRNLSHIAKYPVHLGYNDGYPPFVNKKNFKKDIFNKSYHSKNFDRFNFWGNLAKKHSTLKFFYEKEPEKAFINSDQYKKLKNKNFKYLDHLKEFYRNGVVEINNFLPIDFHDEILKMVNENQNQKILDQIGQDTYIPENHNFHKKFHSYISDLEEIIFEKKMKPSKYSLVTYLSKLEKKSAYQASCLWHQDRFIPAIKFFYYIEDVQIDPTEFCLKSHIIDEQFISNAKVTTYNLENDNEK